jgi:heptosyltransferase-2
MKRILVVNVNWLGDVVLSTPALRALRKSDPGARLTCMVVPRCREVLEGNPGVDEIIIYDEDGIHGGFWGKPRLVRKLRAGGFDEVYFFHRSFTRRLAAALAGIPKRVGYPAKKGKFLLTVPVELPERIPHKAEYFLNLLEKAGIKRDGLDCEFYLRDEDRKSAGELLKAGGVSDGDFLAVLNAGGNWKMKRWPAENFAALADLLMEERGAKVVFSGAGKDRKLVESIAGMMKQRPANLCGRTTLKQLGALFERADLVVSNDTGPTHIAAAVGARVVALFGPTSPELTGPCGGGRYTVIRKDVGCEVPCYRADCEDNRCMKAITVEDVLAATDRERPEKTRKGV